MDLENKVVIITGAGLPNGIGAGIARCFANEKAKVVITDLEGSRIDETIDSLPGDVSGLIADAANQDAMGEAAEKVIEQHGQIDVLVNNAGIGGPKPVLQDPEGGTPRLFMSDELWDVQMMSNLRTTFSSASAVAPKMQDGGSIINIASVAALGPTTGLAAYGAAKAGVVHFTRTLAMQLAPRRIRANCICPGLLWTRAWEMGTGGNRKAFEDIVARSTPLGAEQTPEDIGNLAAFYASSNARMITGAVVAVDGGSSIT